MLALGVMVAACHVPELPIYTGSSGSINGTWVGTISEDETGLSNPFVMILEHVDETVTGVMELPLVDVPEWDTPIAEEDEQCNIGEGVIVDGALTFRFVMEDMADAQASAAYDATTETIVGEWRADTSMGEYQGVFEVSRVSWVASRWVDGCLDYLGCSDQPPSLCRDGLDNDDDGLIDLDDPACNCGILTSSESPDPPCQDGLDNDGDGLVDDEDFECPFSPERGMEPACGDGLDNDLDGLVDLDDPACEGDPRSWREVPRICEDGLDNDDDGLTDDDDPDCHYAQVEDAMAPACSNNYDDDGDGLVDLDDPACRGRSDLHLEWSSSTCSDGLDNEGDGVLDDDDSDCVRLFVTDEAGIAVHFSIGLDQACDDGEDNDGDGLIDLDDPSCSWGYFGSEGEPRPDEDALRRSGAMGQCFDELDNDGDGLVDRDDPSCSVTSLASLMVRGFESAPPCFDGQDNDGDGLVDREDPGCAIDNGLYEAPQCGNGRDDDLDGLVDDADPSCAATDGQRERWPECDDGHDNDGDGLIDADDPKCFAPHDEREIAACSDGLDNDGDGYLDLADDGCADDPDRNDERLP